LDPLGYEAEIRLRLVGLLRLRTNGAYTSTPKHIFIPWCLISHKDNFTYFVTLSNPFSVTGRFRVEGGNI